MSGNSSSDLVRTESMGMEAAEGERARIAHEYLGRVAVEPEKAEGRAERAPQNTVSSPAPGTFRT